MRAIKHKILKFKTCMIQALSDLYYNIILKTYIEL